MLRARAGRTVANPVSSEQQINVPHLDSVSRIRSAIFWFGRVFKESNYADVRIAYTNQLLYVEVEIFDRDTWYDTKAAPDKLTEWDSVSLLLDVDNATGGALGATSYRFDGQLNWWEPRDAYQAAYQGNGSAWAASSPGFTTETSMRGKLWNDNEKTDRGWTITYEIPFSSLGLSGPPAEGSLWKLGVIVHDRDDAAGTSIPDQVWPSAASMNQPGSWGTIHFGLPTYAPPAGQPSGSTTIRHKLDGAVVVDAAVGGGAICGTGLEFWTEWGDKNYAHETHFNIQNQMDVADWPCFSKYYVTFPLDSLPTGQAIHSATLTLHEFGGSQPQDAQSSLIQVMTVAEDWDENNLTWNTAPQVFENVSQSWVEPLPDFPGWPGVPFDWDVSRAVAQAYATGQPLRLVLYSADAAMHSGKYFSSSDAEDWNAKARPTLNITWGNP